MKRRRIFIVLIAVMILSLTGCRSSGKGKSSKALPEQLEEMIVRKRDLSGRPEAFLDSSSLEKKCIEYYKQQSIPSMERSFDALLEKSGDPVYWTVETVEENYVFIVHAYAYGVDLVLESETGQGNQVSYSGSTVEITFNSMIGNDSSFFTKSYDVFVDGIYQNEFYKQQVLQYLDR